MSERTRQERLLTFVLLPMMVLAVLVLTGVTFRTRFQQERLRQQSVVEATLSLANEKTARLDQMIVEQDNVVAAEINLDDLNGAMLRWLAAASRETPTIRAVLVLDLSNPAHELVGFASRRPGGEDDTLKHLLLGNMLADMSLANQPLDQLRHLHGVYGRQSQLVSYWQREALGHRYLVVAWHDVGQIVHDHLRRLYQDRDGQSRVNVVDAQGNVIFGPSLSGSAFTVGLPFPTTLYKWRLNVSLLRAEELAASAARRRILELSLAGISSLVVVAGIIVVMLAAARERKLSNLKSDFVANVSHELKTPLSLVRMFGELLQTGRVESEEKRQQYLQIIVSESERLSALIENVLDFAKVERGKSAYDFVEGDLAEVVGRAVEACRPRADRDEMALRLEVQDGLPRVLLDERAIEIAVINLIDNALKYAKDGKSIEVRVQQQAKALRIAVVDHGPGLSTEERRRVFERFARGANAKHVRGSGIGLALVKHIALAHGGDVTVEDTPGGSGTTFVLRVAVPSTATRHRATTRSREGVA